MATAAEPRSAALPLPGGSENAAARLHPLLCGRMKGPPAFFHREEGRLAGLRALGVRVPRDQWVEVPVVAFLLEHPSAGVVLVDTGFHPAVAVEPGNAMGRLGGLIFKDVRMEPEQAVSAQLRERGIDAADVKVVVMTHLHADHASGIAEFGHATFIVSAEEWAAASEGGERDGYLRRQFDHAFDWRTIDFEAGLLDSFAGFGRAADLFGDGSVRLLFTPGHTAGHCSVLVRVAGGEVLICGDAAYTRRTIDEDALPARMEDEHRFRRSLREIQRTIEQTPGLTVIPGHDMAAWRRLPEVL